MTIEEEAARQIDEARAETAKAVLDRNRWKGMWAQEAERNRRMAHTLRVIRTVLELAE